ncbi:glycosyltransferase family 4 protein [Salinisphaera hydrothermalis]|uniref:glycosyltransferase family 4 protein n=1 Tax=Salinisphaera hydrothermalis TaxID=563188 RepID=UPI00333E2B87
MTPEVKLRVLLLNDSREAGGAESVYNASFELLSLDDRFEAFRFDATDVNGRKNLLGTKAWNTIACEALRKKLVEVDPAIVWIHNFHGFLSAAIFRVLKSFKKVRSCVVVMTMHDYQLVGFNPTLMTYKGSEHSGSIPLDGLSGRHAWLRKSTPKPLLTDVLRKMYWRTARWVAGWEQTLDAVFCPSPMMKQTATAAGLPRPTLLRQPSFISSPPTPGAAIDPGRRIRLLYLGRLSPEKGSLRFFSLLGKTQFNEVESVDVVGGGAEEPALKAWIKENGLESRVRCHGHMARDRALAFIDSTDAVVVSSICYENAPMVIVEAAHFGMPSLVRAFGSLETFADDLGCKVLWHDDGTPEALSEALGRLREKLSHPRRYDTSAYSTDAYLDTVFDVCTELRNSPAGNC